MVENEIKNKIFDVFLGIFKFNYIDLCIIVVWLKKWDVKLVKMEGIDFKGKKIKVKKEEFVLLVGKGRKLVGVKDEKINRIVDLDCMELDLKVILIGYYFFMIM